MSSLNNIFLVASWKIDGVLGMSHVWIKMSEAVSIMCNVENELLYSTSQDGANHF